MKFLLLLVLTGCAKNGLINKARNHFANETACMPILKEQIEKTGCSALQVEYRPDSTLIRCNKPDNERGRFWDNYIFRISSSKLRIDSKHLKTIEEHTICIDKEVRIEAWKP